jgi:putative tricarboxylic transport membrane protein
MLSDILAPLLGGFTQLADPSTWLLVMIATLYGVAAGAMPGMGTTLAFGLALPFTFAMSSTHAVSFLLAISVGTAYGNSIPAILMGIPGNPAAILTVIDGHTLHRRGESGLALGIAFVAALGGQLVSILMFILLVLPLMNLAYSFLSPEIFSLYFLGMIAIISLTGDNMVKGIMAAALGVIISLVGFDTLTMVTRLDFGFYELRSGLDPVAVVIGLLAVSELFRASRQVYQWKDLSSEVQSNSAFPPWSKIKPVVPSMMIGTVLGTVIGAIPGAGGTAAAMISYQYAQLFSKRPQDFGKGSVEGIGANEAAQNASNCGELIPTLGLGLPVTGSMVLLLSCLSVHGFVPGPLMVANAPELLYATVAGLLASTIILIVFGWRMATFMLKAVLLNRQIVIIIALAMIVLGVYAINTRMLDVGVTMVFGAVGYFMLRYGYSPAVAALAVFLGGEFERNLRVGLNMSEGSFVDFFTRPITATIMVVSITLLVFGIRRQAKMRQEMRAEAELASGLEKQALS